MNKFNRWVAKNYWFTYISACVLLVMACIALSTWIPPLVAYLLFLVGVLVVANWVNTRGNLLLNDSLEQLNQSCDPMPLMNETELQLHYPGPENLQITRKINYTSSLHYMGRFVEIPTILSGIQAEQKKGIIGKYNMVLYYRNLMHAHLSMNADLEAETAFLNMLHTYAQIKNKKRRNMLAPAVAFAQAEIHFLHQEYDRAMESYRAKSKTMLEQVGEAWFHAKVFLAQGEAGKAKEKLKFVVHNGNRLYIVTEAKRLLEKMNTEESI